MVRYRKSKEEIVDKIKDILSKKDLSINEIATKMTSNWSTVVRALEFMEKLGVVEEKIKTHKIRIFGLKK